MISEQAPFQDPFKVLQRHEMDCFPVGVKILELNAFKQEIRGLFSTVGNGNLVDAACFAIMQNGMTEQRRNELAQFFNSMWNEDNEGVTEREEVMDTYYSYMNTYDFRLSIDKHPKKCGEIWELLE